MKLLLMRNYMSKGKSQEQMVKFKSDDWVILKEDESEEFVGYDRTDVPVFITRYRKITQKDQDQYQLVFNITPFYAESGGQVGDQGFIESESEKLAIKDTRKENNLIVHFTDELPKFPASHFHAYVAKNERDSSARNHSATHLLHEALREILGTHVEQKGSLVSPDHLRFDFSHFSKINGRGASQCRSKGKRTHSSKHSPK